MGDREIGSISLSYYVFTADILKSEVFKSRKSLKRGVRVQIYLIAKVLVEKEKS